MLQLTLSWVCANLKPEKLYGRIFHNPEPNSLTLTCLLESESCGRFVGGAVEVSGVGIESTMRTVARAIGEVLNVEDQVPLDISQLIGLKFQASSGSSRLIRTNVWKGSQTSLASFSHWTELEGTPLSPWRVAEGSLWDWESGSPLAKSSSGPRVPGVYSHQGSVYCRLSDLLHEQRRLFEAHFCLRAPLPVPSPENACSPVEMDMFLCAHVHGYKFSDGRKRFLQEARYEDALESVPYLQENF